MKNTLSRLLKAIGILCLIYSSVLLFQRYNPYRLNFSQNTASKNVHHVHKSIPMGLVIPGLKINLPIIPAVMNGKNWETTDQGVSYLISSAVPGEKGNSIFYGHNWSSLLGNLVHIKSGQDIIILLADGSHKKFKVSYIGVVSASQSSILQKSSDRRITLYTCTGFLDTKRFVVVAQYQPSVSVASNSFKN